MDYYLVSFGQMHNKSIPLSWVVLCLSLNTGNVHTVFPTEWLSLGKHSFVEEWEQYKIHLQKMLLSRVYKG
jgi:hypothetical protein